MATLKPTALRRPLLAVATVGLVWHALLFGFDALLPGLALTWFVDLGALVVNLLAAAAMVYVLWHWGWLRASGVTTLGRVDRWWIVLPFLAATGYTLSGGLNGTATELIGSLVMLVLGVGLSEEIYSRALSLQIANRLAPLIACAWVGLVFGAGHFLSALYFGRDLEGAAWQVLFAGLSGFVLCAVRIAIHTIWPLVLVHGFDDWAILNSPTEPADWWLVSTGLASIAYAVWLLRRYGHEFAESKPAAPSHRTREHRPAVPA